MDRATVIVALPPIGDRINKISSEAVPHLTLLYLGDASLSEDAILYVQHACAELSPFGLSVDYRGELGEDKADVLFFEDNAWDLKRVKEFRHHLLLNDEIKRAFENADQYPEWNPHLTLGYPEAPAREKEDEDVFMGYVNFDRIAVWDGDFSGPEFRLKYDDRFDIEVSMSEMTTADRGEQAVAELFHYGVKGMKWGVRNDRSGGRGKIKRGLTKANVALNAGSKVIDEGEKKLIFLPQDKRDKAASATQRRVLGEAAALNRQPQFKGKDIKNAPQLKASYQRQLEKKALDIYQEELTNQRVQYSKDIIESFMNPSGDRLDLTAPRSSIRHSDENDELLASFEFTLNDLGQVIDADLVHSDLAHRNVPAAERRELKKEGKAKPDESFPIANADDLTSAIKLAKSDSDRRHVIKNAKRLGLENKIPDTWNADGSLKHSEMTTAELGEQAIAELFHYGTKGMKWGVRRDISAARSAVQKSRDMGMLKTKSERASAKESKASAKQEAKAAKKDQKWEKSIYTMPKAIEVHNAMADGFNAKIDAINTRHPKANIFDEPDTPESKAYMDEITTLQNETYAAAVSKVHGTSPSGRKEAVYIADDSGGRIEVRDKDVKHASSDEDMPDLVLLVRRVGNHIAEVNKADTKVAHADTMRDFLVHYGVKGMKWGVTTKDGATSATKTAEKTSRLVRGAKDVQVSQRRAGTYVKAKGGERQTAHDDAVRAQAGRRIAKKSTTDALSNKQLKDTIERMRLEQEFSKLDSKVQRKGQSFIARLFRSPEARSVATDLAKKVAKTAGAAA